MRPILKSTKVSARKPAAAKAKTSNPPSAGKGLPRKARKPGARRRSAPIECSCAYVTIIGHTKVGANLPGVRVAASACSQ